MLRLSAQSSRRLRATELATAPTSQRPNVRPLTVRPNRPPTQNLNRPLAARPNRPLATGRAAHRPPLFASAQQDAPRLAAQLEQPSLRRESPGEGGGVAYPPPIGERESHQLVRCAAERARRRERLRVSQRPRLGGASSLSERCDA